MVSKELPVGTHDHAACARRYPLPPDRTAAWVRAVIRFAELFAGPDIRGGDGQIGSGEEGRIAEVVVRRRRWWRRSPPAMSNPTTRREIDMGISGRPRQNIARDIARLILVQRTLGKDAFHRVPDIRLTSNQ